jgi:hypothetical protein
MTLPHALNGLSDIAADYDLLLCDIWGVIHNGRESWAGACEALSRFNRDHGQVILISNSPRPTPGVVAQLDALKVPRDSWRAIVAAVPGKSKAECLARFKLIRERIEARNAALAGAGGGGAPHAAAAAVEAAAVEA